MGERLMIALHDIVDLHARTVVIGDDKADGIRPVVYREAGAVPTGIAKIAHGAKSGFFGLPRSIGRGTAHPFPAISQRQESILAGAAARGHRIEIGARHFGGIVAQDMSSTRLEALKNMVAQQPGDSFLRYGLAMEYKNAGDLEAALAEFRALMGVNPDYSAAYFHGGQTLERLGRLDEARALYHEGIEVTTRKGDLHTRNEIQAALDILG